VVTCRESNDVIPPAVEEGVSADQQRTHLHLNKSGKRTLQIAFTISLKKMNPQTKSASSFASVADLLIGRRATWFDEHAN
jgi:hypothetical protein